MKRFGAICLLFLMVLAILPAQEIDEYSIRNALIGFGSGSRLQGDDKNAKKLLAGDIAGLSLMAAGGLGLAATHVVYKGLEASVGKVSTTDYKICHSLFGLGALVFLVNRLVGFALPLKFVQTEKLEISADGVDNGVELSVKVKL